MFRNVLPWLPFIAFAAIVAVLAVVHVARTPRLPDAPTLFRRGRQLSRRDSRNTWQTSSAPAAHS
jgi:hypothetical protein